MKEPPDPLEPLLDQFGRQTPALRGSLAPEVWRRIAINEEPERGSFFTRIHAVFAQRAFAAAFVVGCVLLGMFLAEVRRSRNQADYDRELVRSYLRLIDPRRDEGADKVGTKSAKADNLESRSRTGQIASGPRFTRIHNSLSPQ